MDHDSRRLAAYWADRLRFAAVGAALATASVLGGVQERQKFSASVDVTRLELTVLDKKTRTPVVGLTGDDFIVTVAGAKQEVVFVTESSVPGRHSDPTNAFRERAHDLISNDLKQPRLFVIVMNDARGDNDPFDSRTGKDIANTVVDELGESDLAAVVFVRDNRNAQDFTADRAVLRAAIDRFNPMDTAGTGPLPVLGRAQAFLTGLPGYRRAVIYVSPIGRERKGQWENALGLTLGIDEAADADARDVRAVVNGSLVAHVPIHVFSTHGLHAPTLTDLRYEGGRSRDYDEHLRVLRMIARASGGRAVVANNSPAREVQAVFDELAAYYILGYKQSYPLDGKLRWLQVDVRRRDVLVMPNDTAFKTPLDPGRAPSVESRRPRVSGLVEALESPLPTGALPLRLASVPIALPGSTEQAIALTLGLPAPTGSVARDLYVLNLLVFDGEGRRELLRQHQTVAVSGVGSALSEVAIRVELRPGRYNVRLSVGRAGTDVAGSVYAPLTVPDFARAALSMSGVAIGLAEGRPIAGRESLSDILPFGPTAIRSFASDDHVGALVRVHQSAMRPAQTVTLETEIIDAGGRVLTTATKAIAESAFVGGTGAEHRYELPLASLDAGDYLLRFVATAGESRVQRDVRFSVRR